MEVMKQARQRAIRDLVDQRPIRTQQELAAALHERGFRATQATVSRDRAGRGLAQGAPRGATAQRRAGVGVAGGPRGAPPPYVLPAKLVEAEPSGEARLRRLLADLPVELRE